MKAASVGAESDLVEVGVDSIKTESDLVGAGSLGAYSAGVGAAAVGVDPVRLSGQPVAGGHVAIGAFVHRVESSDIASPTRTVLLDSLVFTRLCFFFCMFLPVSFFWFPFYLCGYFCEFSGFPVCNIKRVFVVDSALI